MKNCAILNVNDFNCTAELLTPIEMAKADHLALVAGQFDRDQLMHRAGAAVCDVILRHYASCQKIAVLCGPGNNGGDGFVVARLLNGAGMDVVCFSNQLPQAESAAARAYALWHGKTLTPDDFVARDYDLFVDALYGAGLDRDIEPVLYDFIHQIVATDRPVIAIDLPTGISGATGRVCGAAIKATKTVTFFRLKPGHVCYPGREYCGDIVLADIGIDKSVLTDICPLASINVPGLWIQKWPELPYDAHKFSRGHAVVFSGPENSTGAARLSALAAARVGAGIVTIMAPENALPIHRQHLTSIMLRELKGEDDTQQFLIDRKVRSVVLGPGFGSFTQSVQITKYILANEVVNALVLDADALSALAGQTDEIFALIKKSSVDVVMTPHEGEFKRVFPDLAQDEKLTRIEKARNAAEISGAIIIYKGPDTIVASPERATAVSINGTPYLATAGSGDVLAGLLGGISAQRIPAFEAACASVWVHAECGQKTGVGTIAEDLIASIPSILRELRL